MHVGVAIIAGILGTIGYVPYAFDIIRGRVKPARSTRIMLALLLVVALLQQKALGSSWLLAITIGQAIGSTVVLALSVNRGTGGLSMTDKLCYALLCFDVLFWFVARSPLAALHLSILADMIAFAPAMVKTWRYPWSETLLFYVLGTVAPLLNTLAASSYRYRLVVFPLYLACINLCEVLVIIIRRRAISQNNTSGSNADQLV